MLREWSCETVNLWTCDIASLWLYCDSMTRIPPQRNYVAKSSPEGKILFVHIVPTLTKYSSNLSAGEFPLREIHKCHTLLQAFRGRYDVKHPFADLKPWRNCGIRKKRTYQIMPRISVARKVVLLRLQRYAPWVTFNLPAYRTFYPCEAFRTCPERTKFF